MAILKHIASKSADYGAAIDYLKYEHDERTMKPLRDQNGNMRLRAEFIMEGINCNPETFDAECEMLNAKYHKNQTFGEIKSHHYIISFDPKDREEKGLTAKRAQSLGMEFARMNFPGHQAIVCTHTDGSNGSGNIHVHIVINSLRKLDIEPQVFAERPCDSRAGYKHHLTKDYLIYQKQFLMELCQRENLSQIELLTPSERKISDKEYWANQRGQQKLDTLNEEIRADGLTPAQTKFQTELQYLRDAIDAVAAVATSFDRFRILLSEKYKVLVTKKRGRYSYLHPDRQKNISERVLGTRYGQDFLEERFKENSKTQNMIRRPDSFVHHQKTSADEKSNKDGTFSESVKQQRNLQPFSTDAADTFNKSESTEYDPGFDYESDPIRILYIRSNLRLVVDLQTCTKAQLSQAYTQKVKISNLKVMAKTIAYVQEQGYNSRDELRATYDQLTEKVKESQKALRTTDAQIKAANESIHYTGQHLANKAVYSEMLKSTNIKKFRQEHSAEIEAYEEAVKYLKDNYPDEPFPSMKALKERKEQLREQQQTQKETYEYYKSSQKDFRTVCSNVDFILGQGQTLGSKKQKAQTLS